MKRVFVYIFFFFCLFPFLDFLKLGTDTQPNALLLSVIPIATLYRKRLPLPIYLFGMVLGVAILVLCFSPLNFNSFRDVANYCSILFVTWASYLAFQSVGKLNFSFFAGVNIVWFVIGFVQTHIYSHFMTFLLNGGGRGIDSEVRGVTSISTEPSQYGTMCILFAAIAMLNFPLRKTWWILLLLIYQLVFLAQSATALLTLVVGIVGFLGFKVLTFSRKAIVYALIVVSLGFVTYKVSYQTIKEQRIYKLGEKLVENPILFLAADGSVSERFMFVYYSFKGMVDNHFLPRGYSTFNSYMQAEFKKPRTPLTKLLLDFTRNDYTRILSGLGAVVFQLGIFGLLVPIGIVLCFWGGLREDVFLFTCITLLLILLTAFPIMTAIVGFLLGNVLHLTHPQQT